MSPSDLDSSSYDLLTLQGLTKRFGAVTVVRDCDLSFKAGSIHALLGANGAGKSTLVRMIAGLVTPSAGQMLLEGKTYAPSTKRSAELAGVEIVQQELNLIPTLTVAENLLLSRLPAMAGVINRRQLNHRAAQALDRVGLQESVADTMLGDLGVGWQQMIEIAAALDRDCRLLILDEPTAALSATESDRLFEWLGKLREQGVAIIYISHRLDEVKKLSDSVSILRDGQVVATHSADDLTTGRMVELMSGDVAIAAGDQTQRQSPGEVLLSVHGMSGGPVSDVSFEVHRGECFGIAGLVGSGRTELLRMIYGADPSSSGFLTIGRDPRRLRFRHPREAVEARLAMVTEDRKQNGLLLSKSIRANTTLAAMWTKFASWGIARPAGERSAVQSQCESLGVRCHSIEQSVATLSGGNQQKVAIAKWLVRDADIFLFDEPTRGIDVGARHRIYRLFGTLSAQGKAMVVVSSDTEELMEICDRIGVMSGGRLVANFERDNWSAEQITAASFSEYLDQGATA